MIIDCIADIHGYHPKLEGGDLLIVAGDLTASDKLEQYDAFYDWMNNQNYKKKILIAGNHDNMFREATYGSKECKFLNFEYLCDSGTEFEGLKVWGSPWTLKFEGMNPKCMAFTCNTEDHLADKFEKIPHDTDILITHSPPLGILDKTVDGRNVGSKSLLNSIEKIMPEMVIFGHIHEQGGKYAQEEGILYINGSIVDERYRNVNRARRVIFNEKMPKMQRFKVIE